MQNINPETQATKKLLPEFQKQNQNSRLFRNNTGMAHNQNGIPIFFGIGKPKKDKKTGRIKQVGGGDYIGWETIKITPDMIGQEIAVFLSVEIKTSTGRLSKDQRDWAFIVEQAGGKAIVLKEGK